MNADVIRTQSFLNLKYDLKNHGRSNKALLAM